MSIIPESVSGSFRPPIARPLATDGCSSSRPFFPVASVLLLAAPPVRLALPAPRIAGLLSDGIPPQDKPQHQTARPHNGDYLIRERRSPLDDIIAQIDAMGPFQTIEEADAEIAAIHEFFEQRRRRIIDDYQARRRAKGM